MGNTNLEPELGYKRQGRAQAFQTVVDKSGVVTTVAVYLDSSTELVAGIYEDNNGQSGALIAQGRLNMLKLDAWNSVTISEASVTAGQPYWFAILGSDGEIDFLKQEGSGTGVMVMSKSRSLTSLPDTWTSSKWGYKTDAAMSIYGKGY